MVIALATRTDVMDEVGIRREIAESVPAVWERVAAVWGLGEGDLRAVVAKIVRRVRRRLQTGKMPAAPTGEWLRGWLQRTANRLAAYRKLMTYEVAVSPVARWWHVPRWRCRRTLRSVARAKAREAALPDFKPPHDFRTWLLGAVFQELFDRRAASWNRRLERALVRRGFSAESPRKIVGRAVRQASLLASADGFDLPDDPRRWFWAVVRKEADIEGELTNNCEALTRFMAAKLRPGADKNCAAELMQELVARVVGSAELREAWNIRAYLFGVAKNLLKEQWRERPPPEPISAEVPARCDQSEIRLRQEDAIARAIVQIGFPHEGRFLDRALQMFRCCWKVTPGKRPQQSQLPQREICLLFPSLTQTEVSRVQNKAWRDFCDRVNNEVACDPVLWERFPFARRRMSWPPCMPPETLQFLALMFTATQRLCHRSEEHMQAGCAVWWALRRYPTTAMLPARKPLFGGSAAARLAKVLRKPSAHVQRLLCEACETWEELLGGIVGERPYQADAANQEPLRQWHEYARQRLGAGGCAKGLAVWKTLVEKELRGN